MAPLYTALLLGQDVQRPSCGRIFKEDVGLRAAKLPWTERKRDMGGRWRPFQNIFVAGLQRDLQHHERAPLSAAFQLPGNAALSSFCAKTLISTSVFGLKTSG